MLYVCSLCGLTLQSLTLLSRHKDKSHFKSPSIERGRRYDFSKFIIYKYGKNVQGAQQVTEESSQYVHSSDYNKSNDPSHSQLTKHISVNAYSDNNVQLNTKQSALSIESITEEANNTSKSVNAYSDEHVQQKTKQSVFSTDSITEETRNTRVNYEINREIHKQHHRPLMRKSMISNDLKDGYSKTENRQIVTTTFSKYFDPLGSEDFCKKKNPSMRTFINHILGYLDKPKISNDSLIPEAVKEINTEIHTIRNRPLNKRRKQKKTSVAVREKENSDIDIFRSTCYAIDRYKWYSDDRLPHGWKRRRQKRRTRASGHKTSDCYYLSPWGRQFRSLVEVDKAINKWNSSSLLRMFIDM